MKTLCTIVVVLAVALGVLGYVRGWYTVITTDERIDISIDRKKVETDSDEWRNKAQKTIEEYRQPGEQPGTVPGDPNAPPGAGQPGELQQGLPRLKGYPPPPGGQPLPR